MIKVGVIGAGHLGKIHLNILNKSEQYDLIGFHDNDQKNVLEIKKTKGYTHFESIEELIDAVDVVDIVTPTISHYKIALMAINKGKNIFIEKPIASNLREAEKITSLAKKNRILGQVGHVERFNPGFKSVIKSIKSPMFIESHRLAEFNNRGTDVSVVLDLMIHDIDIILSTVKSKIKSISSSGIAVISKSPDIANARIEFENGCVANLTSSRISLKKMRKTRFFQKDAYISVDFLEKKAEVLKIMDAPKKPAEFDMILKNAEGEKKQIYFENPSVKDYNAISEEFTHFAKCINKNMHPIVSLEDGTKALKLANQIIDSFNNE
tara:strand:+ start:2071 stop:3039 length:969 start_codon:yes stop_codon:yes gene_type:complete